MENIEVTSLRGLEVEAMELAQHLKVIGREAKAM